MTAALPAPLDDLVLERDFLLCLVDLVDADTPDLVSKNALRLIAQRAGAARAYLQLGSPSAWSTAIGFDTSDRDGIRALLSTTIVGHALRDGQTIESSSALTDPRFGGVDSVRRNHIEAVLCVPIGRPAFGALYLQAHTSGYRFPSDVRAWAERFVAHLAPVAGRLLPTSMSADDPTLAPRAELSGVDALAGTSVALASALRWATTVAPRDVSVLITGAPGTGKSTLATVIAASARDAVLVDDIDRLSLDEQRALASTRTRIIATTTHDLEPAVARGAFSDDLYRRVSAATFVMPSLDERRADIPLIAARVLGDACARHGLPALTLSPTAQQVLLVCDWPGQIRQLADVVHGAALRAHSDRLTTVDPSYLFAGDARDSLGPRPLVAWQIAIRDCQRRVLKDALEVTQGNITEAARRLGIARSYAYELVRDLNLR